MGRGGRWLALLAAAVLMPSRGALGADIRNGDFSAWVDDSTPVAWSAESRTHTSIREAAARGHNSAPCLELTRLQAGVGNNCGVVQSAPVVAGRSYAAGVWFLTPEMPDTSQFVSARIVITWRNSSNAAVGYTNPPYVSRVTEWTRQAYLDTAPDNPNGDSVAVSADVIIRTYGRTGGLAGGVVDADDVTFGESGVIEAGAVQPAVGTLTVCPNPFSRSTRIGGTGRASEPKRCRVSNATGRVVRTLRGCAASDLEFRWNGRDDSGRELPAGTYVATLEVGARRSAARKVLLLRY